MGILRKAIVVGSIAIGAARLSMGKKKFDRKAREVKVVLERSLRKAVKTPAVQRAMAKGRRKIKAATA